MRKKLLVSFLARKSIMKKNGMAPIYCRVRYDDTIAQFSTKIDVPYFVNNVIIFEYFFQYKQRKNLIQRYDFK